jgi:methylenetetrahydrofolate reductase (NADPH)
VTKIADLLAAGRCFSFEFFPPRTEAAEATLRRTLVELEPLGPSFVSFTYGAGGTTRDKTYEIVVDVLRNTSMTPMAHLCCAGHTVAELRSLLEAYRADGVENILALRGDPPADLGLPPGDLLHAAELVVLVREMGPFSVGVASHPEGHPACPDRVVDRQRQAEKLAQADFGVTQFFFNVGDYLGLIDDLAALGVHKPVLPGIMPVTNVAQIERFAKMSGAAFPAWLAERLHAVADDPEKVRRVGVEVATELSQALLDAGAPGLHFYTLNRSQATTEIWSALGLPVTGPSPPS